MLRPFSRRQKDWAMRLDHATWPEVDQYLTENTGIILPVGSLEQHGPMGLIGVQTLPNSSHS